MARVADTPPYMSGPTADAALVISSIPAAAAAAYGSSASGKGLLLPSRFQPTAPAPLPAAAATAGAVPLSNVPAQAAPRGPLDFACDLNPRPNPLLPGSTAALFGGCTMATVPVTAFPVAESGSASTAELFPHPSTTPAQITTHESTGANPAMQGHLNAGHVQLFHAEGHPANSTMTTSAGMLATTGVPGMIAAPDAMFTGSYTDLLSGLGPTPLQQQQQQQQQYQLSMAQRQQQPSSPVLGGSVSWHSGMVPVTAGFNCSTPLQSLGSQPQQQQQQGFVHLVPSTGPLAISSADYITSLSQLMIIPMQGHMPGSFTPTGHMHQLHNGTQLLTLPAVTQQLDLDAGSSAATAVAPAAGMYPHFSDVSPVQLLLEQQQLLGSAHDTAAAAAAAAAAAGRAELDTGTPAPEGPFISLQELAAAGLEGLFAVNRTRAEALIPLEAGMPESKRDRAATARRALASKGNKPTSSYRGVTHHVRTGRWEAHIWLEGKQVYLGGFDSEGEAAMAYDLAAVKFRGRSAQTNFSLVNYEAELAAGHQVRGDDLVAALRRQSRGPASTSSSFRGVTRHAKGRWEARIGRGAGAAAGRKYTYLGLYDTEIEAAMAYDRAAVRLKGLAAITNFDLSMYLEELNPEELQQYINSGNCPPEAMEAAAMAAAAAANAAASTPTAAAAGGGATAPPSSSTADDSSVVNLPQKLNKRGQPTRKAAAAAAAVWMQQNDADDDVMQNNNNTMMTQDRAHRSRMSPSGEAAAAGSSMLFNVDVSSFNGTCAHQMAGRLITTPAPTAVAAAAGSTGTAPPTAAAVVMMDVDSELLEEQRQYRQQLLEQEQQQQQVQMQAAATAVPSALVAMRSGALRRTHTAPPMSAQFLGDLALGFSRDQAGVQDFVLPEDEQYNGIAPTGTAGGTLHGTAAGSGAQAGQITIVDTSKVTAQAAAGPGGAAQGVQLLTVDCFNYSDDDSSSGVDSSDDDIIMRSPDQGLGFCPDMQAAPRVAGPVLMDDLGLVKWVEAELEGSGLVMGGGSVNPVGAVGPLGRSSSDISSLHRHCQHAGSAGHFVPPAALHPPPAATVSPVSSPAAAAAATDAAVLRKTSAAANDMMAAAAGRVSAATGGVVFRLDSHEANNADTLALAGSTDKPQQKAAAAAASEEPAAAPKSPSSDAAVAAKVPNAAVAMPAASTVDVAMDGLPLRKRRRVQVVEGPVATTAVLTRSVARRPTAAAVPLADRVVAAAAAAGPMEMDVADV